MKLLKRLQEHTIEKRICADPRDDVLAFTHEEWERALHPNLSSLAGMMEQLATHGILKPPPLQDHLHEAFRRVLLNQIPSMDDDVPLTANVSRNSSPRCTGPSRPGEAPSSEYNIPVGPFEKAQSSRGRPFPASSEGCTTSGQFAPTLSPQWSLFRRVTAT